MAKKSIPMASFRSQSHQETEDIAASFASNVRNMQSSHRIITLYGNLGAGKTVFTKGFAKALGVDSKQIKSPTYTFVREYQGKDVKIYHFDFYRIVEGDDMINHEIESILQQPNSISIIEWPERVESVLKHHQTQKINIKYISENERTIEIY